MIRQPSTFSQIYAWHRKAVAGQQPDTHDGLPEAGWFKRRLVKDGPWVPVRIFVERELDPKTGELACDEVLRIEVGGVRGRNPAAHWTYLKAVTRDEYETLLADSKNDRIMTATHVPVDLSNHAILPRRKAHA